jgi:hypothetical protein
MMRLHAIVGSAAGPTPFGPLGWAFRERSSGAVAFQICASVEPGMDFAIVGEIDASNGDLFATALRRLWPLTTGDTIHVDVEELRFIGQRQLVTLDQTAVRHSASVVLHSNERFIRRLVDLLDLTAVRVEPRQERSIG